MWLMCLGASIVLASYNGNLTSYLSIPQTKHPIDNLHELIYDHQETVPAAIHGNFIFRYIKVSAVNIVDKKLWWRSNFNIWEPHSKIQCIFMNFLVNRIYLSISTDFNLEKCYKKPRSAAQQWYILPVGPKLQLHRLRETGC